MLQSKSSGFTLIELLIVVLIVSILSAIALPQYQIAVTKSKLSSILIKMASLRDAEESYFLSHGQYTDDLSQLEISFDYTNNGGSGSRIEGGYISFDNGTYVDVFPVGPSNPSRMSIQGGVGKRDNYIVLYDIYLSHSSYPGRVTCTGYTDIGNKVCKSMGF